MFGIFLEPYSYDCGIDLSEALVYSLENPIRPLVATLLEYRRDFLRIACLNAWFPAESGVMQKIAACPAYCVCMMRGSS